VHYRLAGAYDSNIALLVTAGRTAGRATSGCSRSCVARSCAAIDLQTNREFHYGLVHWFLARDVLARPTTRFVLPYLALVGLAWLSRNRRSFRVEGEGPSARVVWTKNPLEVLEDTYWLLNMDPRRGAPAAHVIWDHDHALLQRGLGFYRTLAERLGLEAGAWEALVARLSRSEAPSGFDDASWARVRASHAGFQLGLEVLTLLPLIGVRTGFYELRVEDDLFITIPPRLLDKELQAKMRKVLAPPPRTQANRIVAVSGGMFYAQEAPHLPPLVTKGSHFTAGQPLYVIEVMKMFNKVLAPFAGTVDEVLVSGDGTIVQKGQPLYRVTPDETIVEESHDERAARLATSTSSYVEACLRAP
jgi:biotin carboxyl carrier protein